MATLIALMAERNRLYDTAPIDLTADLSTNLPTGLSTSFFWSPTAIHTGGTPHSASDIVVVDLTTDDAEVAVVEQKPSAQAGLANFRRNFNKKELNWLHADCDYDDSSKLFKRLNPRFHEGIFNVDEMTCYEMVETRKQIRRSIGGPFDSSKNKNTHPVHIVRWTHEDEMASRRQDELEGFVDPSIEEHGPVQVVDDDDCHSVDILLGSAMNRELSIHSVEIDLGSATNHERDYYAAVALELAPVRQEELTDSECESESDSSSEEPEEDDPEDVSHEIYNPSDDELALQMKMELAGAEAQPELEEDYNPSDHDLAHMLEQELADSDFESEEE